MTSNHGSIQAVRALAVRSQVVERLEDRVLLTVAASEGAATSMVADSLSAVTVEGGSAVTSAAVAARPNFVFVLTDDQRYDAMGFVQRAQGSAARFPWLQTPNLDRLRTQSTWVRNAFVTSSVCSPARASYLTGMYNHKNGVQGNFTPLPSDSVTYASLLQQAGYDTGYIGKWHMGLQSGQRPGFSYSASYVGQGVYYNNVYQVNGSPVQTTGWVDSVTTDFAVQYLQSHVATADPDPFALVIGYKSPHHPFTPPAHLATALSDAVANPPINADADPPYTRHDASSSTTEMRDYFRTVMGVDEQIGRLMDSLSKTGLEQNTVFVFASDNGFMRGEHGEFDKRLAYEESIRVPMLVRYPGLIKGGTTLNQMVLNVDIAPTFLDLAGVAIPPSMDGKSIKGLLTGATTSWRSDFFIQYFEDDGYPPPYAPPNNYAVRTATAKLVKWPGHPTWTQLFNLATDPYEINNLYNKPSASALQQEMLARYDAAATRVGFLPDLSPAANVFKVNFQPAASPAVPDYVIDGGQVYGSRNGQTYGWSVSHTDSVFDRQRNSNQLLDTGVAVKAGAKWEMAVPNGRYTVKVGIGDMAQASTNTVFVEGKVLFSAQALRGSQVNILPITVDVTDGRLTIGTGSSANLATRLTYLTVAGLSTNPPPPPPPAGTLRINFQPAGAPTVAGYLVDAGHIFAARSGQSFGWTTDHTNTIFDRNVNANQLLDTLVSVKQGAKWELAVPSGQYTIKVGVGDAAAATTNNVWIEGKQLYNYQSLAANVFSSKSITVNVTDGRLTLGIGSAATGKTRINYLELSGQTVPPPPSLTGLSVNFQPASAPAVAGYMVDSGQLFGARNGQTYGWNIGHTDAVVDQNVNSNQLLDTRVSVKAAGKWEVALPNGMYTVTVGVGDSAASSKNNVWIEGLQLFNYLSLPANLFSEKSILIDLRDGKLTLGIGSAASGLTRLTHLRVSPLA